MQRISPRTGRHIKTLALLVGAGVLVLLASCGRGKAPATKLTADSKAEPTAPVASPAAPVADRQLVAAKELYANHCAQCHGDEGDGNGPAARFLYPKPRNFRLAQFRLVTTTNRVPSDDDLLQAITRGMPGSAMFPFGHLSEADRQTLAAYVRHLTRTGLEARLRQAAKDAGEDVDADQLAQDIDRLAKSGTALALPGDLPDSDNASTTRGQAMYKAQCATCHGDTGKGDGVKEQRDEDGTPTRPRDFTRGIFKGGRDRLQLYARIAIGMPGTPMPSSPHLKPAEVGDLVNYIETMSDPAAQAKVEHKRSQLIAKQVSSVNGLNGEISSELWQSAPTVPIVVSPLWWRDYDEPDLQVQAIHDGQTLAIRLAWQDATANEFASRADEFEDMVAVQFHKGGPEPFLGMGLIDRSIDIWQWRASWQRDRDTEAASLLDEYPFDTPLYEKLTRGREKNNPSLRPASTVGNQHTCLDKERNVCSLTAAGFGSTTFRPPKCQLARAASSWANRRWTVILRRPLQVQKDEGIDLSAKEPCSIAFAIFDGQVRDRAAQKLVSIWHDLKLE